jgi:hypothetical protein
MNQKETIKLLESLISYIKSLTPEEFISKEKELGINKLNFNTNDYIENKIELIEQIKLWCFELAEEYPIEISKSRIPYTYHYDFIRTEITPEIVSSEIVSRADIAKKLGDNKEDIEELWFICFYFISDVMDNIDFLDFSIAHNNFKEIYQFIEYQYLTEYKKEELRKKYYPYPILNEED